MQFKSLAIAAMLSIAACSSFATDNTVTGTGKTFSIGADSSTSFSILTNATATLLGSSFVQVVGGGNLNSVTFDTHAFSYNNSSNLWSLGSDIVNLAAGNHTLTVVTGAGWSPEDYSFGGKIKFNAVVAMPGSIGSIAAVPEPETYAMMLAGLGAMGFMARRRKSIGQS